MKPDLPATAAIVGASQPGAVVGPVLPSSAAVLRSALERSLDSNPAFRRNDKGNAAAVYTPEAPGNSFRARSSLLSQSLEEIRNESCYLPKIPANLAFWSSSSPSNPD